MSVNPKIFLQTHVDTLQDDNFSTPTIRIFGTSLTGNPILCHVIGFQPYFYADHILLPSFLQTKGFLDLLVASFNLQFKKNKMIKAEVFYKKSIYNYSASKRPFLKLTFTNTNLNVVKTFIESGFMLANKKVQFKVYENHINHVIRFMVDTNMYGMTYVKVKKYEYLDISEITAHVDDIEVLQSEGEFCKLPPLKILSFDIECIGKTDAFPSALCDPVIQIGNTVVVSPDYHTAHKTIFTLGSCAAIPGASVFCFQNEAEMLTAWKEYFVNADPDIVIGYNIKNFDFPYLFDRAANLKLEDFMKTGRTERLAKIRDHIFSSRQAGNRASKEIDIDGRIIFDMYSVIKRDFNLRSYSLNSVSVHFLNEQKEDVPYSSMRSLQEGTPETRKRIATYCLRDTYLPIRLFKTLNVLPNYTEMARVTGVPIEFLSSKGQAIKVLSQILRKAKKEGYVVPQISGTNDERFEGGFVMAPEKGFYSKPVSVLDFSSLYPSIMIVHNLCYTTLLTKKQIDKIFEIYGKRTYLDEENNFAENNINDLDGKGLSKDFSENTDSFGNYSINNRSKTFSDDCKSKSNSNDIQNNIPKLNSEESTENIYEGSFLRNDNNEDNIDENYKKNKEEFCDKKIVYVDELNLGDLKPQDIERTPTGNYFVRASKKKGLLPDILATLIAERKKTKISLSQTSDPELKASLNARQLALKISANSVYGFTGATQGQLPCLEISQSVTSFGRDMIGKTKRLIEDKFNKEQGFTHNAHVIYGDTDCVMINFEEKDVHTVFELSKEVAAYVSSTFIKPISLEFEKVYYPYLLMNKKRYAGLIYTNPDSPDKIDTKGIETVRRDNCEMVRTVIETCLDLILMKKDVEGAKNYVKKKTIKNLYLNKIDLSQLVISKSLTKENTKYASKQAHVELAEKLKKRDAGNAPLLGDRVGYIIVKGQKNSPAYERSEDPVFVLNNNISIDTEYYLENQLSKPIYRLFEPILENVTELTKGDHTREINIPTSNGPLTTFLQKKEQCIGCKSAGSIICKICVQEYAKHFFNLQKKYNDAQCIFAKCWTECQRCQGSVVNEVLCVNRDCPIFYKRSAVKKELKELEIKYTLLKKYEW